VPDAADEIERARVEILRARSGVTVWNIDPTPDYTPSTRAGADRAIRSLELAAQRIFVALDLLRTQVAEADAGRPDRDPEPVTHPSP
jgi:hypothetical protein